MCAATAGALHKTMDNYKNTRQFRGDEDEAFCLSMLLARYYTSRKVLASHMPVGLFEQPIWKFQNPFKRLDAVENILDRNLNSVMPMLTETVSTLCEPHLRRLNLILAKNRMISISILPFIQ